MQQFVSLPKLCDLILYSSSQNVHCVIFRACTPSPTDWLTTRCMTLCSMLPSVCQTTRSPTPDGTLVSLWVHPPAFCSAIHIETFRELDKQDKNTFIWFPTVRYWAYCHLLTIALKVRLTSVFIFSLCVVHFCVLLYFTKEHNSLLKRILRSVLRSDSKIFSLITLSL